MPVRPDVPFADIEKVLVAYLEQQTGKPVDTKTPADGVDGYTVLRVDGTDDGITDFPRVEVASWAEHRSDSLRMAEEVRQALLVLGGQPVDIGGGQYVLIDYCRTDLPPESLAYENKDRRAYAAYYQLGLRRPRPTPTTP